MSTPAAIEFTDWTAQMDDVMAGGRFGRPVRRGDTVERLHGPGSANVHALLQHFERQGYELAPRFLGLSEDGRREILSFIEGETGYPPLCANVRSDAALSNVAKAIRRAHDASLGFTPADSGAWAALEVSLPGAIDCIGHRDLAPWNIVFQGDAVVGIIDWDAAGPSNRVWDLSYAAYQFVPMQPTADLQAWGWDESLDRAGRLRLFIDAYDMDIDPLAIVDLAIVRLTSIAAHIEQEIRAGNPAFDQHREENHGAGYRAAAAFVIDHRDDFVNG